VLKRASIGACVVSISILSFGGMAGASAKSQATEWAKQNKGVAAKIRHDLQNFTTAADNGNLKKLEASCSQLGNDVSSAQKLPPIPVKSLETLWSRALSDFATAAAAPQTNETRKNFPRPAPRETRQARSSTAE